MASCGAWYYKDVPWKKDSLVWVKAHSRSGKATRRELGNLAMRNGDAQEFALALDYVKISNGEGRNPFGCAEPRGVYEMLHRGAAINQIFIGLTYELRGEGDNEQARYLKPCPCCSQWLTPQDRQGVYQVDIKRLAALRDLRLASM